MRKIVLTSAAMLSALLFATIAATMPVEREAGGATQRTAALWSVRVACGTAPVGAQLT